MSLQVIEATGSHKIVLRHLHELYSHDFSEFDGRDVDDTGEYGFRYLDEYWVDPHVQKPPMIRLKAG